MSKDDELQLLRARLEKAESIMKTWLLDSAYGHDPSSAMFNDVIDFLGWEPSDVPKMKREVEGLVANFHENMREQLKPYFEGNHTLQEARDEVEAQIRAVTKEAQALYGPDAEVYATASNDPNKIILRIRKRAGKVELVRDRRDV